MPPKEIHFSEGMMSCWILNPINGEKEEFFRIENAAFTPEDLVYDDREEIRKEFDWYTATSVRILLTNNDLKMHGRPMRRGSVNKRFKEAWGKWRMKNDIF